MKLVTYYCNMPQRSFLLAAAVGVNNGSRKSGNFNFDSKALTDRRQLGYLM